MSFALLNGMRIIDVREHGDRERILLLLSCALNLFIFVLFLYHILSNASLFLNVAPEVSFFVHGTAFLGGLFAPAVFWTREIISLSGSVFRSFHIPVEAFTRDIWLICLSCIIGAFGEGLYFWVFPLYIQSLNADYVQLGTVYSVLFGVSALLALIGGFLTDRFDRKKLLLAAWGVWIFTPLIYSFAQDWTQLIPGAVLWGFSNVAAPVISVYIITAVLDRKRVTYVLSFVFATFSLSYIFAPAVGGYLGTVIGTRSVLQVASVLILASTIVLFFIRSQHPPKKPTNDNPATPPPNLSKSNPVWHTLLTWTIFFGLASFFMTLARTLIPTFLSNETRLTYFQVQIFGSFTFAGVTFIGIGLGLLGDRWRKSGALSISLLLFIVSLIPVLIIRDRSLLMVVAIFYGGAGVTMTLVSSAIGTIAPEARRGLWVSIPQSLSLLASFIAPYLAGFLYTISPYYPPIISLTAAPFLALYALLKLKD
jgi:MFS family permease